MSFQALSSKLGRDYKNAHAEVRWPEELGFVDPDPKSRVRVHWTIVEARMTLAA